MSPLSAREANRQRAAAAAAAEATVSCTDLFGPVLQTLLDCCHDALAGCDRDVGRAFIAPGANVAWDDCCDGQLWVRLATAFPSGRPFPNPDTQQPCGITVLAARIAIGIVRCAAVVDDDGVAPAPDVLTGDANGVTTDASILLSAIQCCALPGISEQAVRIVSWTPSGPQGGCVGGEWEIIVGLDNCGCGR